MDRPGSSKSVSTHDPDLSDQIRILRESGNVEDDGSDGDIDDVDDSDADPDFVIEDINRQYEDSSGSEDEDEVLIEEEEDNEDEGNYIVNEVAENTRLPPYFIERMKKTESGSPNSWKSEPPPRKVRTPTRNILRTGLPGIRGPAKALKMLLKNNRYRNYFLIMILFKKL